MRDLEGGADFEAAVRRAFVDLVYDTLPAAACRGSWSVTTPAAFERILLDHVLGAPFETRLDGPSGACAGLLELVMAVDLAGRLLEGRCCLEDLDRRSQALRAAAAMSPACEASRALPRRSRAAR